VPSQEDDAPSLESEPRPSDRPPGPLEGLIQEVVRRGAALGFSSFFVTEEAVRRAFSDRVPDEWSEYFARQSEDVRRDVVDRMAKEFGNWLRTLDLAELFGEVLQNYEVSAKIDLNAARRDGASEPGTSATLQIVPRRK